MSKRAQAAEPANLLGKRIKSHVPDSDSGQWDNLVATRQAVALLLHRVFQEHTAVPPGLGNEIETELYELHKNGTCKDYRSAARNLAANLKRNNELRQRLLARSLCPAELVRLDTKALATSAQQEELTRLQEEGMRLATLVDSTSRVFTTEYKCPQCSCTSCDYMDAGRRDIGKSETWGAKEAEGRGRVVTCLTCHHRWEVDNVT